MKINKDFEKLMELGFKKEPEYMIKKYKTKLGKFQIVLDENIVIGLHYEYEGKQMIDVLVIQKYSLKKAMEFDYILTELIQAEKMYKEFKAK